MQRENRITLLSTISTSPGLLSNFRTEVSSPKGVVKQIRYNYNSIQIKI